MDCPSAVGPRPGALPGRGCPPRPGGLPAAGRPAAPSAPDLVVQRAYEAFNRGDLVAVLGSMCEDVDWHDTWRGSRCHGRAAVATYWCLLMRSLVPRVEVLDLRVVGEDTVRARAHVLIHDTNGTLLAESGVWHRFLLRDGRIARMDARAPRPDGGGPGLGP